MHLQFTLIFLCYFHATLRNKQQHCVQKRNAPKKQGVESKFELHRPRVSSNKKLANFIRNNYIYSFLHCYYVMVRKCLKYFNFAK